VLPAGSAAIAAVGDAPVEPTALTHSDVLIEQSAIPLVSAPSVDLRAVAQEDDQRRIAGLAPRFAIPNRVFITPATEGRWEALDDRTQVWRLRIAAAGAVSLNLGFNRYRMPEGGQLLLHSADNSEVVRPFTSRDNAAHGELWTPVVHSDEIVLELTIPAAAREELSLELTSINVGYRGFEELIGGSRSGSCNVDVVCPEGDDWRNEIPSVAAISTGGGLFCSGFMVNNATADASPYFMTAYHCGISSGNAASLVAYWNYQTSTCGGSPDGQLTDFQSGSFFRSRYSPSDFVLVLLDEDPDPAWGITFAGWDRSGADANSAVAIHHPSVDEKRISFEYDPTSTTSYLGTGVPGDGTHVRVTDWDLGTTEGGSSGSPLFNQDHRVIGQLHGGFASCSSQTSDWYGKFSISWTGGGSATTRLSDWLDPLGSGVMTVDTLGGTGCVVNADCDDGLFCTGFEGCVKGRCKQGMPPCAPEHCHEDINECDSACDNGVCETGEDCNFCAEDCISGTSGGASCGNEVCETANQEDCQSCPIDCNGKNNGNPAGRFCCGGATEGCSDSRCTQNGYACTTVIVEGGPFCCGNGSCQPGEDIANCPIDCDLCGNSSCDPGEDMCTCPGDCGPPAVSENPASTCQDGVDNDCDSSVDCVDSDCASDSACECGIVGAACTQNSDCCDNKCRGPRGGRTCR
jgi:hypothetical protein